jgi:hypothetical protein
MNTVPIEPMYVTSLEEVFYGGTLVALTMAMHGFGMLGVLRANYALKSWLGTKTNIVSNLLPVILTSWLIMLVHLVEVALWALFFLWKGAFPNHSTAYYFSLNEYTTVGSNFNLPLHWRLLEGMLATAGLLAFAWSTGILFTLAQEFLDQHMTLFKQRHLSRRVETKSTPLTHNV